MLAAKSHKKEKKSPTPLRARQNVSEKGSPGCQFASSKMKGFEEALVSSASRAAEGDGGERTGSKEGGHRTLEPSAEVPAEIGNSKSVSVPYAVV